MLSSVMQPVLIAQAIFYCLQFFIPVLVVINIAHVELPYLNLKALIISTNVTILIAGLLTFFIPVIQLVVDCFSGAEYAQYGFINRMGILAWLGLLTQIVIPQIMWSKFIRRSLISTCIWLGAYWLLNWADTVLIKYITSSWATFTPERHLVDYAGQAIIFLMVIVPVYLLVSLNKGLN
jgi:hypothetical protein